ncbi:hypothetical protein [Pedobacter cryophilus]|uniref:Uncharacterized protein n=1 Tax=Pedobacter cryophilus TaxID=2571271 RepID=A0A4U1C6I1_9SPHI|nr:hypothetical protein [Pedobacter cryophilus]TKB98980.1 hypothetical protein FA046_07660 [Pedobacter cryophilus]
MLKKPFLILSNLIGHEMAIRTKEIEENRLIALGSLLSNQQWALNSTNINDYEFKIFSQFGDDGIIQYLIKHLQITNKTFIEFGVEDFLESNTRFLMMNNNWSGFVMDGSSKHMNNLKKQHWYWKFNLKHKAAFIDKENINSLLADTGFNNLGLLHIDLDGNDFYILKTLDFSKLNPAILILEYNSVFGNERAISVPYDKSFVRTSAHYSNLFFGASLPALHSAATEKGYALIGCALNGHNAFYVRRDLLNDKVKEQSIKDAYIESNFRESRDKDYNLSYLSDTDRLNAIKGLTVFNVLNKQLEKL